MTVRGSCHCHAIQFEVTEIPAKATRCTCSFCSKRGALWSYHTPDKFKLLTARDRVATYQWRSYTVQHHHCAICGCGAYTETPSWVDGKPDFSQMRVSINIRLLDDVDIDAIPVDVIDGKNLW
ncbi:GFA family protein [Terrarubrum flagellatum]|uniref:GFA family protein n=1 Tax=Terrirubrum flagellatum TaxID=2895980 RepID=UPI003144E2D0